MARTESSDTLQHYLIISSSRAAHDEYKRMITTPLNGDGIVLALTKTDYYFRTHKNLDHAHIFAFRDSSASSALTTTTMEMKLNFINNHYKYIQMYLS